MIDRAELPPRRFAVGFKKPRTSFVAAPRKSSRETKTARRAIIKPLINCELSTFRGGNVIFAYRRY